MEHPNTLAATAGYLAAMTAQWLVQRYAHVALADYWKQVVDAAAAATVLYVGKAGVRAALVRVWNGPKRAWSGAAAKASPGK